MDNKTMGIIYALKQGNCCGDSAIRKFMSEYSSTNWNQFGRESIDKLLRQTCSEYISNANNPIKEIRRYFNETCFSQTEYERQVTFLRQIVVKDKNNNYINGFTDNPYSDFKIFENEEE